MDKAKKQWLAIAIAVIIVVSGLAVWFLASNSPVNKIRVACIGDSITEGSSYSKELETMLGSNYTVGNFGVSLATVNLKSEKPYMNQTVFSEAKAFLPNIVIIMLGTNDAYPIYQQYTASFVDDYKVIVGEFEALQTKPKIIIVVPPPIFNDTLGPNSTLLVQNIIPRIQQVANDSGLPLVNLYPVLQNHPEYFPKDGVHPNVQGSKIIAAEICKAIK